MFKLVLEKAQEPEIKLPTSAGSLKKQESSRKNIYFCFIDYAKTFDCVVPTNWKFLQEMGIPDCLTGVLRVCQGCILSPCLFNLHAEYIMRNAGLEEAQAGIKIAGRIINNLRYIDDTTLMAENEEELKSLLMKVKEESEKAGLKLNFRKLRSWHMVLSLHGK